MFDQTKSLREELFHVTLTGPTPLCFRLEYCKSMHYAEKTGLGYHYPTFPNLVKTYE